MSIEESINGVEKRILPIYDNDADHEALVMVIETARKYQQLQADYENRLKADLEAILVEIQLEIEELDLKDSYLDYQRGAEETREYIVNLIQQKIDSLREEEKPMTTLTPKPTEDKVYVVGFDQYAGGALPVTEAHLTDLADVFTTVLPMLTKHDKVSIISTEDYSILDHDFASMSRYSINIWKGEQA